MTTPKIRVGLIGAGGWTSYGHIPALRALPEQYDIAAITARRTSSAQQTADDFDIPTVHATPHALIEDPAVDLVAVLTPAPQHAEYAKAAIAVGKDVYAEWPLTTSTADSRELLDLAQAAGVRHLVGLQRRLGPSALFARDLVAQGHIGRLRGARLLVSTDAFVPERSEKHAWSFDLANFSNILSIYLGHHLDTLMQIVGPPERLTGIAVNQFSHITVRETGEKVPNANPDAVAAIGNLQRGGLLTIHVEGGQERQSGLLVEISGTDGVLRLTNPLAFANPDDNLVQSITGDNRTFQALPVPEQYRTVGSSLDESQLDLAHLYAAHARDKAEGTQNAPGFADAVLLHELIDQVAASTGALTD